MIVNDREKPVDCYHWTDPEVRKLGGNQFLLRPQPPMLLPEGMIIQRKFKELGKGKQNRSEHFIRVIYDEAYVVEYLRRNLAAALNGITHDKARELITKALKAQKALRESENEN